MRPSANYEPTADAEDRAITEGVARAGRYRLAYEEQLAINLQLVAEARRLAEEIEARFTERWPPVSTLNQFR